MAHYLNCFLVALGSHWESDIFAVSKHVQEQNKDYYFFDTQRAISDKTS